jgi:DNA-binding IclR family transcriptional regulator
MPRRGDSKDRNAPLNEVIARAAAVLRTLKDTGDGLDRQDVAQRANIPIEAAEPLLLALESQGLVRSTGAAGRLELGPAFARLAASMGSKLVELANPIIARFSHELRETVDLAVLNENTVLFIHQIVGPQRLRAVSAVGESFPLYCTANGKAILAALTRSELLRLVPKALPPYTTQTITTRRALLPHLESIRASGVAYDLGEHTLGICAVGAAVRDFAGHHLAISVPVPSVRFYDNRETIATRLLSTRDHLQDRIIKTQAIADWR